MHSKYLISFNYSFDAVHADLDCVGCQNSYGDYFTQKQTVWTINALESEDQFCGRMAWALYELVNVGTTTAPDNTERLVPWLLCRRSIY